MKKVLRAIGGFFAKIGRWIANTAWVQPLLIVGGIFAIIFSIPYIKNWVKSWGEEEEVDEDLEYYKNRAVSCEGAEDGTSGIHYGTGNWRWRNCPDYCFPARGQAVFAYAWRQVFEAWRIAWQGEANQ